MLGILAMFFFAFCCYEWGRTSSEKRRKEEERNKMVSELKAKLNRYENKGNHRF